MPRTDLDLASRALGGSVRAVSDEFFAPGESLVDPRPAGHDPVTFGPRGKLYDGWETRRRRTPGEDRAVVALGLPGLLHEVVVDTAFFVGNFPPEISVEAAFLPGAPSTDDLAGADWVVVVPRSPALGDTANRYPTINHRIFTHVRLTIHPDGGVARLRVLGTAMPDPRLLGGRVDLAALASGGDVSECSNMFYSDARKTLFPGGTRNTGEGWETARRRSGAGDHLVVQLAAPAEVAFLDVDTSFFIGNAPGRVRVSARADAAEPWRELLPETQVAVDAHNRHRVADLGPVTAVRLDVFPDGGLSRFHVLGEFTRAGLTDLVGKWLRLLRPAAYAAVLAEAGIDRVPVWDLTEAQLAALVW